MKTLFNNKITLIILSLVIGLIIGKYVLSSSEKENLIEDQSKQQIKKQETWTCSMHPQIRQNEPGDCPICGMELITVDEAGDDPLNMEMSEEAMRLAEIQTIKVEFTNPEKEIIMQGKVKMDEREISLITSRFSGRIDKLFVDFTGMKVKKGQKLASLYSPELINAQQELLEALKFKDSNPMLYKAARNKLKLWNITESQINEIEKGSEPKQSIDIISPSSGIVLNRAITLGEYVKEGSKLFEIVDLSKVWIVFDAYEADIPWLKIGDKINFKINTLTNKSFDGKIEFIDPIINSKTRTTSIRMSFNNKSKLLKPEMFAEGRLTASLPLKGSKIIIPKSSVLWTGKRSIVYVKLPELEKPTFQFRVVKTGLNLGEFYTIESGLNSGEQIVVNGAFKIDAAAQLAGKYSMMNQPESSTKFDINTEFKHNLTLFFNAYIDLKNSFVDSDFSKATKNSTNLIKQLKILDMELLKGDEHILWMKELKIIKSSLESISTSKTIEKQRASFKPLSESLSNVVEAFGLHGVTVYKDYCPMAINDKGAYWLSEIKEIKNPYFGDKMLKCGEVKNTFGIEKTLSNKPVPEHNH